MLITVGASPRETGTQSIQAPKGLHKRVSGFGFQVSGLGGSRFKVQGSKFCAAMRIARQDYSLHAMQI